MPVVQCLDLPLSSITQEDFVYKETKFPEIGCSYIPPDQCSDTTPPTCCERIKDLEDAGVILRAPVIVLMVPYLLAIFG